MNQWESVQVKDWLLIPGRVGYKIRNSSKGVVTNYGEVGRRGTQWEVGGGGASEILSVWKGGGGKNSLSHAERGTEKVLG